MTVDAEQVALAYLAQFAGRTDAFSIWAGPLGPDPDKRGHWVLACTKAEGGCPRCQWFADHRDESAAPPDDVEHQRLPLTPADIVTAFRTKRPISGYVAGAPDDEGRISTHLACLDVDIEPGGLMLADRVARAMKRTGLPAYIEPSRRGAHLWCVLDGVLPAIVIRRALRALLQAADIEPDPKIELRPGQDRLQDASGLGNALRLPLMPHQATGVAGELLEPGGRIVASRVSEAVLNVEWASAAIFAEWAEKWVDPNPAPPLRDPGERPQGITRFNDEVGVTQVLVQDWGVERAAPGRAVRCPAHDDRNPSLSIMRDDRRAYCHSPGCLLNNDGRGRDAYDLAQLAPGAKAHVA